MITSGVKRQIFAMGGGGFSMEPDNPLLDDYLLNQVNQSEPKIAFIATASANSPEYIGRFYDSFKSKNCVPSHLCLTHKNTLALEAYIFKQDVIYVGGGNTKDMLILWKKWGLDAILKEAYHQGILLSGLSAGAICWFEEGLTDSLPKALSRLEGLGILQGSNCPHFDGEPLRQEVYKAKIASGEMKPGIACDDGVGLHYVNEELIRVVSSRSNAQAYSFHKYGDEFQEKILKPNQLSLVF